jgi:hypothetical protein
MKITLEHIAFVNTIKGAIYERLVAIAEIHKEHSDKTWWNAIVDPDSITMDEKEVIFEIHEHWKHGGREITRLKIPVAYLVIEKFAESYTELLLFEKRLAIKEKNKNEKGVGKV